MSQYPFRSLLIAFLSILHRAVLSVGIFDPTVQKPWLQIAQNTYHSMTGAGGSFGFFSPNIGNQIVIEFKTDQGRIIRLHELVSSEVALRIGNMYRVFIESYANEKLKRSVAASLSAQIFRRLPETQKVTMIASVYKFPSLIEHRQGIKPKTSEIYRITFTLGDKDAR